ncbi:hypothetical protein BGZ65_004586 [Modicella reniformis]|uniref:F-box/LRR-repeat protein 15-like leucin rich repeat domain-containing protein n=1 Tax=Modicella reniformis TaxID=1440133 RepID=A0A9P6IKL7_9FUNG|nr:hypothetical protein BGZ65_004586 [Modicella reniformis]
MSRRNRRGNTYVNNVRGPTSALTSFLNERGIRRANPAPAPRAPAPPQPLPPEPEPVEGQPSQEQVEDDQPAPTSSSFSTSQPTRTARLTRGRSVTSSTAAASSSNSTTRTQVEDDEDDDDDDDNGEEEEEEEKTLVPISVSVGTTHTRVTVTSSSSSTASSTKAAATAGDKAGPSKKRRKKACSDDSNDEDFNDITGYVSRSKFSHKGRMPQGSNKIEFCSRCRARFTVKAGSTPAVDEDDVGLLCPTCAGATAAPSAALKPKPAKRARRQQQQKAEIECQVPTLQDLCIQKIANCIEDVEAFGDISDISMDKICKIISRNRSLNTETVQLFLDSRHTDLSLYDCTDIAAPGLQNIAQFCPKLRSLRLKLCGRIDDSVMKYYAEHLTQLNSLSLIGPILITDAAYIKLFEAVGKRFERFELKHSARFSLKALEVLCEKCPNLTHLRLGDLDLMTDDWLELIANLTKLKSLRIRNPERERITTASVVKLIQAVGSGLEELELKGCVELEDSVLFDGIRPSCVRLECLDVAGCEEFTTEGVKTLFEDWTTNRSLTYINLGDCILLKDEALVAVTAHSGTTLQNLNIRGLDELTKEGLLTMVRCENLRTLDASWCRAMDDEVMGQLVAAAPKLNKVMVWGDHRLTECCPSRKGMKIVGREGDYIDLRYL